MSERAWDVVRRAILDVERAVRTGTVNREDHLVPLLMAAGLPVDETPKRPDTWVNVKDHSAWWVTPVGETDPDKAELWIAPLKRDGTPDYDGAVTFDAAAHWEGFPWENRDPTATERNTLVAHAIAFLGFVSGGPEKRDPLIECSENLRNHLRALAEETGAVDNDHLNVEYEDGIRGAAGGIYGDYAGRFNPDVAGYLSDLMVAVATERAPADSRPITEKIAAAYNDAATRDQDRKYNR